MNKEPLVSIIMPTYNREKILPRSINSVIKQNYKNWELIIVDDRSTDNTRNLIENYFRKDNRIKYIYNRNKKGPAGARNCGINDSKGKYVAFLDSDDEWLKNHLEDSVEVLENENINFCCALWYERRKGKLYNFLNKEKQLNKSIKKLKPEIKNNLIIFDKNLFEYIILNRIIFIYHIGTIVIKKEILEKLKGFNDSLYTFEDIEFLFRLLFHFRFCLIRDVHLIYNQGEENLCFFEDFYNFDNPETIKKLNFSQKYPIKGWKLIKKHVKKNKSVKESEKCVNKINKNLGDLHYFLKEINKKINKPKSFFHYLSYCYYFSTFNSPSAIFYFILQTSKKCIYFVPQKIDMYIGKFGLFLKRKNPKIYYFLKGDIK